MRLFRRRSKDSAPAGPSPAEMRGRAAEITDPGELEWEVVWEALKTEPPDDSSSTLTQELGLREEQEITQEFGDMPATEFSGSRHGRRVALRIGVVPSAVRGKGYNEVHVEAPVASFRVSVDDGRLVAEPGAPPEVEEILAGLAPAPATWREPRSRAGRTASLRGGR